MKILMAWMIILAGTIQCASGSYLSDIAVRQGLIDKHPQDPAVIQREQLRLEQERLKLEQERLKLEKENMDSGWSFGKKQLIFETIYQAAEMGNLDDVKQHLKRGTIVNAVQRDSTYWQWYNKTPLLCAIKGGQLEVAEYLVKNGADVNYAGSWSNTPLQEAISCGYLGIAKWLVEKGADVTVKFGDGETPLSLATKYGDSSEAWADFAAFLVQHGATK